MISRRPGLFHFTVNYGRRSDPGISDLFCEHFPRSLRFLQSEWKIRLAKRCSQTSEYRREGISFSLHPAHRLPPRLRPSPPYLIAGVYKGGHICCLERDFSSVYYAWVSPPILYLGWLATQYLLGCHIACLSPRPAPLLSHAKKRLRALDIRQANILDCASSLRSSEEYFISPAFLHLYYVRGGLHYVGALGNSVCSFLELWDVLFYVRFGFMYNLSNMYERLVVKGLRFPIFALIERCKSVSYSFTSVRVCPFPVSCVYFPYTFILLYIISYIISNHDIFVYYHLT